MQNLHHTAQPSPKICEWQHCTEEGIHRAPRSRTALREYHWFCLEHVRQYNARWNYFAGMSDKELELAEWQSRFGHQPTKPMGVNANIHDPLGLLNELFGAKTKPRRPETPASPPLSKEEQAALALFDLSLPLTETKIKKRYKILVKQHHPDVNGNGDDRMIKNITASYQTLLHLLEKTIP